LSRASAALAGSSEGKTVSVTAITGPAITNSEVIQARQATTVTLARPSGKAVGAQDFNGLAD
jgi:hypothetical protein